VPSPQRPTVKEIVAGGYIQQLFRATTAFIDKVGFVTFVTTDPLTNGQTIGTITLQLRDAQNQFLWGQTVPMYNNRLTSASFAPAVKVQVGSYYYLRMVNQNTDAIPRGVYVTDASAYPDGLAESSAEPLVNLDVAGTISGYSVP
jgi:hypothetical protein